MNPILRGRIIEMIDRLERHKSAASGESDLEIGMRTVVVDYEHCIDLFLDVINSFPRTATK